MICSTCANALIRKLEVNLDRGQRITCVVDGSVNLANIVECNQFRAMVYELPKNASVSTPEWPEKMDDFEKIGIVEGKARSQSERMKEYWKKKRERK